MAFGVKLMAVGYPVVFSTHRWHTMGLSLGHGSQCGGQRRGRRHSHNDLDSNSGNTLATQQWVRGRDTWKKRKCTSYTSIYLMLPFIYFYINSGNSKMESMNSTTDAVSRCWVIASDPFTAGRPERVIRPLGPEFAGLQVQSANIS